VLRRKKINDQTRQAYDLDMELIAQSGDAIITDHIDKKTQNQADHIREKFRAFCLQYDYFAKRTEETTTFLKEEGFIDKMAVSDQEKKMEFALETLHRMEEAFNQIAS